MDRSRKNKTGEETLLLGQAAMYLRDVSKLKWRVIAGRLGVPSVTMARFYYEKAVRIHAKKALLAAAAITKKELMILEDRERAMLAPAELSFEEVKALAKRIKTKKHLPTDMIGWVWLYHNGFGYRVPKEIREKIEEAKLPAVDPESELRTERGLRKQ